MKAKTLFLMAGTIGAGMALTRMMRRRHHDTHEHKAKRPRRHTMAGIIGAGVALTKVMRKLNAHDA